MPSIASRHQHTSVTSIPEEDAANASNVVVQTVQSSPNGHYKSPTNNTVVNQNGVVAPQTISISAADLQEPSSLFIRYTVEQINEIEAKIRNDIERKREDLRQMVGERYRDIIQAADTIEAMHHCTRDIVDSLSNLRVHYSQKVRPKAIKAGEAYVQHRIKSQAVQKSETGDSNSARALTRKDSVASVESEISWKDAFTSVNEAGLPGSSQTRDYLETSRRRKLFEVACNTRVLIELSDVTQRAIDQNRLFQAAELCRLGTQCYNRLSRESTRTALLQTIPALARPVEKLEKDRLAVRRQALNVLCDPEMALHAASDAAAALVLVEDLSMANALKLFLNKRLEYIEEIFDEGASTISVKQQAATITHVILNTVQLAYALFDSGTSCPGLVKLKSDCAKTYIKKAGATPHKQVKFGRLFGRFESWMGPVQFDYHYELMDQLESLNLKERFLDPLEKLMSSRTKALFDCVQSVRALGNVRSAVWEAMVEGISSTAYLTEEVELTQDTMPEWAMGLDDVQQLQKPTSLLLWLSLTTYTFTDTRWPENKDIWTMFFVDSFSARVMEIISQNFRGALSETSQKLNKSIEDMNAKETATKNRSYGSFSHFKLGGQADMSVFALPNSEVDNNGEMVYQKRWLFSDINVSTDLSNKNFDIVMKSQGFTPEVQLICKHINRIIQKTLGDVFYCIEQLETQPGHGLETLLLNRFKGTSVSSSDLADQTKTCTSEFLKNLVEFIKARVAEANEGNKTSIVLYLARIAQALTSDSLAGDVRKALTVDKAVSGGKNSLTDLHSVGSRYRKASTGPSPLWDESRKLLKETSQLALDQWVQLVIQNLRSSYSAHLLESHSKNDLSIICTWLELEEQSIRLPSHASISVHQTLGKLCSILNHSDAHAFSKATIRRIVAAVAQEIITAYSDIRTSDPAVKYSQYFATQQLFDIRFLKSVLNCENDGKFQEHEDWLQEFIDPFDFDVINSNMGKYVQKALGRVTVMYGVINQKNNSMVTRASETHSTYGQEAHNVIQLTASSATSSEGAPRLQLLPISIETQMYLKNTSAHARLPDRLKSQLSFGTGFEPSKRQNEDSNLTTKFFGLFT